MYDIQSDNPEGPQQPRQASSSVDNGDKKQASAISLKEDTTLLVRLALVEKASREKSSI
jgi:hypothetical protein